MEDFNKIKSKLDKVASKNDPKFNFSPSIDYGIDDSNAKKTERL
jgi:hypothetical protein